MPCRGSAVYMAGFYATAVNGCFQKGPRPGERGEPYCTTTEFVNAGSCCPPEGRSADAGRERRCVYVAAWRRAARTRAKLPLAIR